MALDLQVNGERRRLDPAPTPTTLVLVIEALAYNPQLVVAEHNGVIVPRTPVSYTHLTLPTKA